MANNRNGHRHLNALGDAIKRLESTIRTNEMVKRHLEDENKSARTELKYLCEAAAIKHGVTVKELKKKLKMIKETK